MKACFFSILFVFLFLCQSHAESILPGRPQSLSDIAEIKLHFYNAKPGDTIYCEINDFDAREKTVHIQTLDKHQNTVFTFHLHGNYAYLFVSRDIWDKSNTRIPVIDQYPIERGDDIQVDVTYDAFHSMHYGNLTGMVGAPGGEAPFNDRHTISFTGKGSERFACYYNWEHHLRDADLSGIKNTDPFNEGIYNFQSSNYLAMKLQVTELINASRPYLSDTDLNILQADVLGLYISDLARSYSFLIDGKDSAYFKKRNSGFRSIISDIDNYFHIPLYAKCISKFYADGVYAVERTNFGLLHDLAVDETFYDQIKGSYNGRLRDKLLLLFFTRNLKSCQKEDSLVKDGLTIIRDLKFRQEIKNLPRLNVGSTAINFRLQRLDGSYVSLADFKGKVVFMDFYFRGCENCYHFYLDNLKYVEEHFKNNKDVVFFSISVDVSKLAWRGAVESGMYTSIDGNNVINLFTNGKGYNDPVVHNYQVVGCPLPVLIDKNGKILEYDCKQAQVHLISTINKALGEN